eukprot:TRINITY_DN815_c0_g1_i1.p1 TRINITY_DN815_c0_g1~~TRINITY_DN815_c0_g1_i1.p1  ORF type:complete len:534 (-),score=113.19 TRINITY_DN815_c0_g1_i1:1315-2916(-)
MAEQQRIQPRVVDTTQHSAASTSQPLRETGMYDVLPNYTLSGSAFPQAVATEVLFPYLDSLTDRSQAVVRLASPEEIEAALAATGCPADIPDGSLPMEDYAPLIRACNEILNFSVRTGHPHFWNQLYGHCDPVSIAGEWLTVVTNTNVHTYEVAPVFTVIENSLIKKVGRVVGGTFEAHSDGLFVPGGSIANTYAMLLARYRACPEVRAKGLWAAPRLVAFVSAHSHYSYAKASMVLGIGRDNLVGVETDPITGAMRLDRLVEEIAKAKASGAKPFFIGATAGTTVTGAFDPLEALRSIADEHQMWLHVDSSWGGACYLSKRYRHLVAGAEKADSLVWNFHKVMGVPHQASCFLTTHVGLLQECNACNASYLFQPDKVNAHLDIGDKTIQCGRRADSIKVWLSWQACGDLGWQTRIDHSATLAEYLEERVTRHPRFRMARPRVWINVCFWYLPASLGEDVDPETASPEMKERVGKVAPAIKARMQRKGLAMIGFQPQDGLPNFFRMVFPGAGINTHADVDSILEQMDEVGHDL